MEIEDAKYEALVAAKADAEAKVTEATTKLAASEKQVETLEAEKVKAEGERDAHKVAAETAKEAVRVAAMKDDRMAALGTGFRAKLDKLETTAKRVAEQAATMTDEDWIARLEELEETLSIKRDAKLDAPKLDKDGKPVVEEADATAGLLFTRTTVAKSGVSETTEVVAGEGGATLEEPSGERRLSVMHGLMHKPKAKATA